jgi:hypothetical protein
MMDDMESSMFLMRAMGGPLAAMLIVMITMTVTAPAFLYVIARWRAHREADVDRQLGLKFALHYFSLSAFQLALGGLAMLVFTLLSKIPSELKGTPYRIAFGMIVPAALVLGAHLSLLRRTNDAEVTGVRRLFLGYNLILTGLVGFVALVMAFQALFMKGSAGELGRMAGALVLVYGSAWAVIGWRFGTLVLGGGRGTGSGPVSFTNPPSSGTATPPAAGTGLPALGGGAFPPIEQK